MLLVMPDGPSAGDVLRTVPVVSLDLKVTLAP